MNFCYTCHLSSWQTCKNTLKKHSTPYWFWNINHQNQKLLYQHSELIVLISLMTPYPSTSLLLATGLRPCLVSLRMLSMTYFQDGVMDACLVLISCQLTQSYAPTAKTRGSFIKMSYSVKLQPAPSSFKSKVWKDFGFKLLYDAQGVRNVLKEIVFCRHCFSELRHVSCIVSWHLFRDIDRILRKCIVAALFSSI